MRMEELKRRVACQSVCTKKNTADAVESHLARKIAPSINSPFHPHPHPPHPVHSPTATKLASYIMHTVYQGGSDGLPGATDVDKRERERLDTDKRISGCR